MWTCGLNDHRGVKHEAFIEARVEARKKRLEGLMVPLNVSKAACSRRDGENKCVHY